MLLLQLTGKSRLIVEFYLSLTYVTTEYHEILKSMSFGWTQSARRSKSCKVQNDSQNEKNGQVSKGFKKLLMNT